MATQPNGGVELDRLAQPRLGVAGGGGPVSGGREDDGGGEQEGTHMPLNLCYPSEHSRDR